MVLKTKLSDDYNKSKTKLTAAGLTLVHFRANSISSAIAASEPHAVSIDGFSLNAC